MLRRRSKPETAAFVDEDPRTRRPRTLMAAAQIMSGPRIERIRPMKGVGGKGVVAQQWQQEAWQLVDELGELRSAIGWLGGAASGARLIAAEASDSSGDPDPVEDGPVAELVAGWAGGRAAQAQIIQRAASHLALVGDTYLVGEPVDERVPGDEAPGVMLDGLPPELAGGLDDRWDAFSTQEMSYTQADGWMVNDGQTKRKLGDALVIRCWNPHLASHWEADSNVRSARPILWELRGLSQMVMASIDSRLAGAGLLLLPQSITFPTGQGGQGGDAREGEDPFVRELMTAMVTPIKDRDSAAAVVPLVAKVPDDVVGKVQHITFSTPLDAAAKDLRDEALRRLAISLDLPPEMLLGLADSNHWNGYLSSEQGVKIHLKPLLVTIAWALTVGWLRPALAELGVKNPDRYMVWVDTSDLLSRPSQTEHAKDLFDRYAIGLRALRRAGGFDEEDAPSDDELMRMVVLRLLERTSDVGPLMKALGLEEVEVTAPPSELPPGDGDGDGGGGGQGDEVEPPVQDGEPGPDDDGEPPAQASALPPQDGCEGPLLAAHVAVVRALEVVGKKLLTRDRRGAYRHVPSHRLHTELPVPEEQMDRLLDGAWETLAELLGAEGAPVVAAVDDYARDLLRTGTEHRLEWLRSALARAPQPV